MKRNSRLAVGVLLVTGFGAPAHADYIRNIGLGLAGAGFDVIGNHNYLSGGADFLITNNFTNDVFRFGIGELRLNGPISLDVSTGRRFVNTLDISFRTALDRDGNAAPLTYELRSDVGAQETEIVGSLFIDGNVSLNAFGFYDVEFTYSSRQTVSNTGNVSNDTAQYDLDLGPAVVSGNIFADILVAITDPFFARAGVENPLASLSGQTQLREILEQAALDAAALDQPLASARALYRPGRGFQPDHPSPPGHSQSIHVRGAVTPEPAVLLLMLAVLPVVLARRAIREI